MSYLPNPSALHGQPLDSRDAETLGSAAADRAAHLLSLRAQGDPTPLHHLPGLAAHLGITGLYVKDEGFRLGLGSFKALGGAYALMMLVRERAAQRLGRTIAIDQSMSADVRTVAAEMTFTCATDGNHGRSVAQGAQLMGAKAVIFVHRGVSAARAKAIAAFGARIIRVDGSYDDSVAEAARVATAQGWTLLSDTSWPGYEDIPALVMQGYTAMVREILTQLPDPPSHVFLQAGVGGFAAAVAGHLAMVLGADRPHVTVVEPTRAACLYDSARAGHAVKVTPGDATVMAMLECYEPSLVAMRILDRAADGFMLVDEDSAPQVMRRLASPVADDPAIVAGESGGAGLAGLMALLRDPRMAAQAGLGPQSRVLVINTEGATDPALYASIVGFAPEAVRGRARP